MSAFSNTLSEALLARGLDDQPGGQAQVLAGSVDQRGDITRQGETRNGAMLLRHGPVAFDVTGQAAYRSDCS